MVVGLSTPVVLIIFNRPSTTARVFDVIRQAAPTQLLVIADGPRADHPEDTERCTAARAVAQQVDWDCEVVSNLAETNMGCKRRISSGLDWAFDLVEEAIILEDDCVPHPTFFRFCEELLRRYRDDKRIMSISGDNFMPEHQRTEHSYHFSLYPLVWGWATWRRAWQHYDQEMALWPLVSSGEWLLDILIDKRAVESWTRILETTYRGEIDTWDYGWTFACWIQSGLTIVPKVNLVSNIGFGVDATHTTGSNDKRANIRTHKMDFPLSHPPFVLEDIRTDRLYQHAFIDHPTIPERIGRKIRTYLGKGLP
jgi:hypothetical protein